MKAFIAGAVAIFLLMVGAGAANSGDLTTTWDWVTGKAHDAAEHVKDSKTPDPDPDPDAAALRVAKQSNDPAYKRAAFGHGWLDLDHDGCHTRDEILARDLTHKVVADDGCDVKSGVLRGPYTGKTIAFNDAQYWTVDIDHVVPLGLAWRLGASGWTTEQRQRFANDPRNLLATDSHTNRSKGDSGPGEWLPASHPLACAYGRRYTSVVAAYDLPVTKDDKASLTQLADSCKERGDR